MESNQKVLIVEDDNFLGDLLADHLNKNGVEAYLSRDAETALKKINQEVPGLLLLDLLLPGMDGLELLEKLKTANIVPALPVIILSNLAQKEKIEQGIQLGARDFMVKANFDLDEITQKVKEVLGANKPAAEAVAAPVN
jgi:DNA-binding response OmpR family regulator